VVYPRLFSEVSLVSLNEGAVLPRAVNLKLSCFLLDACFHLRIRILIKDWVIVIFIFYHSDFIYTKVTLYITVLTQYIFIFYNYFTF